MPKKPFRNVVKKGIAIMENGDLRYAKKSRRKGARLSKRELKAAVNDDSDMTLFRVHRTAFGPKSISRKTIRAAGCAAKGRSPYRVDGMVKCLKERPKKARAPSKRAQRREREAARIAKGGKPRAPNAYSEALRVAHDAGVFEGYVPRTPWGEDRKAQIFAIFEDIKNGSRRNGVSAKAYADGLIRDKWYH